LFMNCSYIITFSANKAWKPVTKLNMITKTKNASNIIQHKNLLSY
jgi:hypothetical protein